MSTFWRSALAWVLRLIAGEVKKEEKTVAATFVFKGKTISVADVETVANAIVSTAKGISQNKTAKEIADEVGPSLIGVGEDVASMFVPGAGAGIEVALWLLKNSQSYATMPQEEVNAWMDRFGAGNAS